jgi:hypothetical protein
MHRKGGKEDVEEQELIYNNLVPYRGEARTEAIKE